MGTVDVKVKLLRRLARLPARKSEGAAGFDLALAIDHPVTIFPGETIVLPFGFAIEIPPGWEAQIRSRSGLSSWGIVVANSPGTIDSDYRGEVGAILLNTGHRMYTVRNGDRVAQMVIKRVPSVRLVEVPELTDTARGERGHGSTGR